VGVIAGILMIACGALLIWVIGPTFGGFDTAVAGIILCAVGAIGLVASLIFWSSWGGFDRRKGSGGQNTTLVNR